MIGVAGGTASGALATHVRPRSPAASCLTAGETPPQPMPPPRVTGKTTVCDRIMHQLQERRVVLISQDSFYRGLSPSELKGVNEYNFDHPNAMDQEAIMQATPRTQRVHVCLVLCHVSC